MQAVIDAARTGQTPTPIAKQDGRDVVLIPGFGAHPTRIEIVNTEAGLARPIRKRGDVTVFDAIGLKQIITDNADAGDVAVYVDRNPDAPGVVAILNGNGAGGPGWGDFRATLEFRWTPQYLKWKANDGKLIGQTEFAEFIEDNMDDIAEPAAAEMLEIAQYLQATRTVNFKSGIRISSGAVQFQNVEDIQAQVGAGQVAIPEVFKLSLAPVFGVQPFAVPARFRYRVQDGKLKLGYKLQRIESMMNTVLDDVVGQLEPAEGGKHFEVLHGLPPAATK